MPPPEGVNQLQAGMCNISNTFNCLDELSIHIRLRWTGELNVFLILLDGFRGRRSNSGSLWFLSRFGIGKFGSHQRVKERHSLLDHAISFNLCVHTEKIMWRVLGTIKWACGCHTSWYRLQDHSLSDLEHNDITSAYKAWLEFRFRLE